MKKKTMFLTAAAALSLTGCTGAASPEADVTCSGVAQFTLLNGPGPVYRRGLIAVTVTDPALATEVPLNNSPVLLYVEDGTALDLVGVCQGGFTDCSTDAGYDNTIELETDDNGVFDFFVRLASAPTPGYAAFGSIFAVFGSSPNTCVIGWNVSTP